MDIHIIYSTVCNIVTIISTLTVYKMHTVRNKKITVKKHIIGDDILHVFHHIVTTFKAARLPRTLQDQNYINFFTVR